MSGQEKRPQVDRRQLQQIIAGLSEGVLLLDTQGSIVWANEAALAAYGVERMEELGRNEAEFFQRFNLHYRNHHALQAENFPMARLLSGDAFSDMVVEVTRPGNQETARRVHCLRGLILTDATGTPESLALVVQDITEQILAEERFERSFQANPAPALICKIGDLRYLKVNQGFLEMTGYARDDVLGRSVYEIDVLEGMESREAAISRLNDWRTIPQMEAMLRLPGGKRKPVIVAGQPIEMDEDRCMLFTFMDLEPRKQAETLLRQSEERFAKTFRLAPVPMILTTLADFRILEINAACAAAMGVATTHPESQTPDVLRFFTDKNQRQDFETRLCDGEGVRNFEARLQLQENVTGDYLVSAEVVAIAAQDCVLIVLLDISERKRSESDLVAAIDAVMKDTSWFSQSVMEKLANLRQPRPAGQGSALAALTAREREVLELICEGSSDGEIAATLGLSRNTVRNHVATLYAKIDVHRRSAAIVWARERGITGTKSKPAKRS